MGFFVLTKRGKMEKLRLGEILVKEKIITPVQLEKALAEQKAGGKRIGHALLGQDTIVINPQKR